LEENILWQKLLVLTLVQQTLASLYTKAANLLLLQTPKAPELHLPALLFPRAAKE
jgi:hypothetical protein